MRIRVPHQRQSRRMLPQHGDPRNRHRDIHFKKPVMKTLCWRRLVATCCGVVLLGQPVHAAGAPSRSQRVVSENYTGPSPVASTDVAGLYASACTAGGPQDPWETSCLRFDLEPTDRFIRLEIEDSSRRPVYGIVWDDNNEWVMSFCGTTKKPIPSPGGDSIYVEVVAATTKDGCYPSAVTQGTVTATFTRRKK